MIVTAGVLAQGGGTHRRLPQLGVYAGPGASGVANAATFAKAVDAPVTHILDFASSDNWAGITGPDWLLEPHAGSAARLEYSLPMLPVGDRYSLASCAAGAYDPQWKLLATRLVAAGLADTIVRPGWEFNGDWYPWSAAGHVAAYVGCFRQIVANMRLVAGQHFAFDWNPTLGLDAMPAELAYPGDSYVDFVGVDAYDTSPVFASTGRSDAAAQAIAWYDDLDGDHGLTFWSRFAAAHHKSLAIPEWGVVHGTERDGGGDDPAYVDHMFGFMTDPGNHVAYEQYFDAGSAVAEHRLGPGTIFPLSQAEFRKLVRSFS